jgi:hypothetical protein
MTLALCMAAEYGAILCAESEITDGQAKFQEIKITGSAWTPKIGFAIVGAGSWDYVKMAYEELSTAILDRPPEEDVSQTIKSVVTQIYANQIAAHPGVGIYEKPSFSLLTAVIDRGSDFPFVVKSVETAVHLAESFDTIGIGQDLARYIGSKLYHRNISADQAAALAAYILEEAKENVVGCGGLSQIMWIGKKGLKTVSHQKLELLKSWLSEQGRRMPNLGKLPTRISPILEASITVTDDADA